ncbi:MAG: CDP-alcohol phosphatidyltransferase family protein [Pseudohongiella sp.]|uniref:CDP-alcohol phosphatidyltransferase family protein n=1 Tax=Pseudohongiella sp. TaxID=1979412 RepID=UPI0034A06F0E
MTLSTDHKNLQAELMRLALCGAAGLMVSALLLTSLGTVIEALLYLLASAALWLLICQQSHQRLSLNRADASAPLYPGLGWANRMTIGRGWLIAAIGGFLLIPDLLINHPVVLWTAAALYSIAAIFDRLDGFVARRSKQTSELGAELDTVFDALGLLVAPLLALQHGKIHVSYLLVSVAYYLFVIGLKVRAKNHKPVYPLPPSVLRRSLAGFQMGYVAVVLWPPFKADVTVVTGFGFMVPLLIGFCFDWLVVSGRLTAQPELLERVHHMTRTVLMPGLRLVLLLTAFIVVYRWNPTSSAAGLLLAGTFMTGVSLMVLGLAGRAGAIVVLMLLAWLVPVPVYSAPFVVALVCTISILLLGCGRFSLWQADDDWVNRQDGA